MLLHMYIADQYVQLKQNKISNVREFGLFANCRLEVKLSDDSGIWSSPLESDNR